jgi:hypothetical protein
LSTPSPTYASHNDLINMMLGNDAAEIPDDEDVVTAVLMRAERRVDALLGPIPVQPDTGLKLDPAALTPEQQNALARATAAMGEHELTVSREFLAGGDEFVGAGLVQVRGPLRMPPSVLEELAGHGLVRTSYCAGPTPPPVAA